MKKTFLLMASLLMMGGAAFAGGGFGITFGPKVGYQTARLSYDKAAIKSEFSNHFTAGIFARANFGRVYVQPEVLWFKTSDVFDVNVVGTGANNYLNIPTGADVSLTLNQMYLQVPVLVGYDILDLRLVTLRGHIGPTANFVLSSKTLVDYSVSATNGDGAQITQEGEAVSNGSFNPKTISWGMQVGLGVDLLKRITLDINYNFGLSKVFGKLNDTPLGETFDFSNIDDTKQNLFMVTVGIKLL